MKEAQREQAKNKKKACRTCKTETPHIPYWKCPEKKYCLLCSSLKHLAPECPVYYKQPTVPDPCDTCKDIYGKHVYHNKAACLTTKLKKN